MTDSVENGAGTPEVAPTFAELSERLSVAEYTITRMAERERENETRQERMRDALNLTIEGTRALRERDNRENLIAVNSHWAGQPSFPLESGTVRRWLNVALRAGVLAGYPHEAHRLARQADAIPGALAIWEHVEADLKGNTSDGELPQPVPAEQAVALAFRQVETGHENLGHANDPRLIPFWEYMHECANEVDFCEMWDTLVSIVGTDIEREREELVSGDVRVSVSMTISRYVEDVSADFDPWELIDSYDVADIIGDMSVSDIRQVIEIDHIDTDGLA